MITWANQVVEPWGATPSDKKAMLEWIERAGRVAYKSEDKISAGSAASFVEKLFKLGHHSVLEHSNIVLSFPSLDEEAAMLSVLYQRLGDYGAFFKLRGTLNRVYIAGNLRAWIQATPRLPVYMLPALYRNYPLFFPETIGMGGYELVSTKDALHLMQDNPSLDLCMFTFKIRTDRGITHELVRHRVLSVTQESTRYVNYQNKGAEFIHPSEYAGLEYAQVKRICVECADTYNDLIKSGHSPQISRDVLPNILKAEIVLSGRFSGWKHFVKLRESKAAHPRIREIAAQIRAWFEQEAGLPMYLS